MPSFELAARCETTASSALPECCASQFETVSTVETGTLCNWTTEPAACVAAHRVDVARVHPAGLTERERWPVVAPRLTARGARGGTDSAARVAANVPGVARAVAARRAGRV
jgi:hypothetical protein